MEGTCSKDTLQHQYNIRCSKFHIIDSGSGINIEVDYTNGANTIPDCFFASAASDEDLKLLYEELGNYLRQKKKKPIIPKSKIIKHDFTNSKKITL